jgi:hypothetical protein
LYSWSAVCQEFNYVIGSQLFLKICLNALHRPQLAPPLTFLIYLTMVLSS